MSCELVKQLLQLVMTYINENKKRPSKVVLKGKTYGLQTILNQKEIKEGLSVAKKFPNHITICGRKIGKQNYKILYGLTEPKPQTRFVNTPFLLTPSWIKQDYDTSCALNSIQQCVYNLTGLKISESTMYQLGYTGSQGTSHDGINNIIKWINRNYNVNLTVTWRNLSDFGNTQKERWTNIGKLMIRKDTSIFFHILYKNKYGHYEVIDIINVGTGYVRALNSLSGGYLENRKISVQEQYIHGISQPSVCIIQKK